MGYKKDMSKYENLEGWERCGFGEQLDRWAEKYGKKSAEEAQAAQNETKKSKKNKKK